jgi:hypothetical protein
MKKVILLFTLGIVMTISVSAQAVLKFKENRHDFGNVNDNTYPTWVFSFVNTGNQDLKLTDVKASCGCTTPQWSSDPIKPGDSGQIKVVFNAAGYAGRQFSKSITVTTNIIENGQAKQDFLFIQGNVLAKVPVIPQYAIKFTEPKHDIGTIKPRKKIKFPVTILNDGDSTVTIKEIISSCTCITYKKGEYKIAPHQSIGINITLKTKGIEPKLLNETIKVTTNIPIINTKALSETGCIITADISNAKKTVPPANK